MVALWSSGRAKVAADPPPGDGRQGARLGDLHRDWWTGRAGEPDRAAGSALASTLGQILRMSETRPRIIVACGAAGGIAATFNAPITGLSSDLRSSCVSSHSTRCSRPVPPPSPAMSSAAFFGPARFFALVPHNLLVTNDATYLCVAILAVLASVIGIGFTTVLYRMEDRADRLWKGRAEWARPAVGGILLGLVLLALPQIYGPATRSWTP